MFEAACMSRRLLPIKCSRQSRGSRCRHATRDTRLVSSKNKYKETKVGWCDNFVRATMSCATLAGKQPTSPGRIRRISWKKAELTPRLIWTLLEHETRQQRWLEGECDNYAAYALPFLVGVPAPCATMQHKLSQDV